MMLKKKLLRKIESVPFLLCSNCLHYATNTLSSARSTSCGDTRYPLALRTSDDYDKITKPRWTCVVRKWRRMYKLQALVIKIY